MKKRIIFLTAFTFIVSGLLPHFAQAADKKNAAKAADVTIRGTITSIDTAKKQIVVKDSSGAEKTISVSAQDAGNLKAGDRVKVSLEPGTSTAKSVMKLRSKK